jgi:hypothetical protein
MVVQLSFFRTVSGGVGYGLNANEVMASGGIEPSINEWDSIPFSLMGQ